MKYLSIGLALFLLIGCQNNEKKNPDKRLQEKDVPETFDIGSTKDGMFTNKYFGLSFKYDTEWDVLTYDELEKMMDSGADMVAGDNERLKKSIEASGVRTAQHFGAYKFEMGSLVEFNPSFLVMSENVKIQGIKHGDDYLEHLRDLWPQTQMNIEAIGPIRKESIDGKEFYCLTGGISMMDMEIRQQYYCTIMKDFALVFILSYADQSQLDEINVIKESVRFK